MEKVPHRSFVFTCLCQGQRGERILQRNTNLKQGEDAMKKWNVLWVILLVAFLVIGISLPAWGAKTIKIGVIGPMKFMLGTGMWNGAVMARDEINAKGGVKVGDKMMLIELVQADSNEINSIADD